MNKTAILVIDPQNIYSHPESELYCPDSDSVIKKINMLSKTFLSNNDLIIFIRHIHASDGSDAGRMFDFNGGSENEIGFIQDTDEVNYISGLEIPDTITSIVKTRYSSFQKTNLQAILESHNIDRLAITGFMTNYCCESTAREAHDRDYFVDFIIDATGNPGSESKSEQEIREQSAQTLSGGFARIFTADSYNEIIRLGR
jgi:nicotinamidase-related amidase